MKENSASDILDYIRGTPHDLDGSFAYYLDKIKMQRVALAACPQPLFKKLALRRLIASNTLQADPEMHHHWDQANIFLADALQSAEYGSWPMICQLNEKLTGIKAELRLRRIFTCDEEYLPPEYLPEALEILKDILSDRQEPVLVRAFRFYLFIVTVHPFSNGNGRTARLLADGALLAAGYPAVCFASPIESHVALTLGGARRSLNESYIKFLKGVLNSYRVLMQDCEPVKKSHITPISF